MKSQKLYSYVRKAVDDFGMIEDGDKISIDINTRQITLNVSDEILSERRKHLRPYVLKCKSWYLSKYAKNVQDASHGAIV